jgi:hypothetical protein
MSLIILITLLALIIILVLISIFLTSKEEFTVNPEDITIHKVDTGKYPKFPLPLFSTIHKPQNKKILSTIDYCGNCSSLESKLVENGIKLITNSSRSGEAGMANESTEQVATNPNCSGCSMLSETWNRYYTIVNNINNFINTEKLPEAPKISGECEDCNDVQNKNRDFSKKKLNETMDVIKTKKIPENPLGIPNIKYKEGLSSSPCCLKTYTEWSIYIISLMEIQNYIFKTVNV